MLPILPLSKSERSGRALTSVVDLTGTDSEDENERNKEVIDMVSGDDSSDWECTGHFVNESGKRGDVWTSNFLGKKEPMMEDSSSEKDEALPNQIDSKVNDSVSIANEEKLVNKGLSNYYDTIGTEMAKEGLDSFLEHVKKSTESAPKKLRAEDLEDGEIPEAQRVSPRASAWKPLLENKVLKPLAEMKRGTQKKFTSQERRAPHRYTPMPHGLLHVPSTAPRRHWNPPTSTMGPFVFGHNLQCVNRPVQRPLFIRRPIYDSDPSVPGTIPLRPDVPPFRHGPFVNGRMNPVSHPRNVARIHLPHPMLGKRVRARRQPDPSLQKRPQTRPITNEVDIEKLRDAALRTKKKESNVMKGSNSLVEAPVLCTVKSSISNQEASFSNQKELLVNGEEIGKKVSQESPNGAVTTKMNSNCKEKPDKPDSDRILRPLTAQSQTVIIHLSHEDFRTESSAQTLPKPPVPPSLKAMNGTTTSSPIDQATTINAAIQAMKQKIAEREMTLQCAEQKMNVTHSKPDTSLSRTQADSVLQKEPELVKEKEIWSDTGVTQCVGEIKTTIINVKTIEECEKAIALCKDQYLNTGQKLSQLDKEICQIEALLRKDDNDRGTTAYTIAT